MSKISKSSERHTFQAGKYVERCEKEGKEPSEDYLNLYKSARQQDEENMVNPEWRKDNLEYDLRSTEWILEKARANETYAQNIYAALCNQDWMKLDVMPILTNKHWSCSWRHAGGIVADMLEKGDYIDWYCSGIRNDGYQDDLDTITPGQYVSEGVVTDEIREDFKKLGWIPVDSDEEY